MGDGDKEENKEKASGKERRRREWGEGDKKERYSIIKKGHWNNLIREAM